MKEINRAIQFGAEATGIGVQGLMDTFLPMGGSELASIIGSPASLAGSLRPHRNSPTWQGCTGGGGPPQPGAKFAGVQTDAMARRP
jgi:hypothetical protein